MITVDARHLACPMPIWELAKAVKVAPAGETVRLLATDPAVRPDVTAWCAATGHTLLSFEVVEGDYVATLRLR